MVVKEYKQYNNEFIPYLSIIDDLMFNSVDNVNQLLDQYNIKEGKGEL